MTLIFIAFGLGTGFGLGGAYSYTDLLRKHADAKLTVDNNYLTEEVRRLRTQVALHIGKEEYSPRVFSVEARRAAA